MPPQPDEFYQGKFYHLPPQFDIHYIQPVPAIYPQNATAGPKLAEPKKPFYINVNPVYPTSEKFNNLAPYPQVSVTTTTTTTPTPETTEYATTLKPFVTDEVVPETTQYVSSPPEDTPAPETSPVTTTAETPGNDGPVDDANLNPPADTRFNVVPQNGLFKPTERFGNAYTPSIRVQGNFNRPIPVSPKLPVIVPTLPPNFGARIFPPNVPQSSIYKNTFPPGPYPNKAISPVPYPNSGISPVPYPNSGISPVPSPNNGVSPAPFPNTAIPVYQNPASCPCYVMTKNENGQTSTTTQSPTVTVHNPPTGLLLLLYPLCPGDSLEDVQKIQPALSSAFVIPYQCGSCENRNKINNLQQFRTVQEAMAQGVDTFNSPTLITNTQNGMQNNQRRYRVARKRIDQNTQN